ncbi:N-acetyltransferase ESCO2, partial [Melospiza georgiana]|uniref:N-acetyltransferase ESCO2 n=1 Tax=Melospiza georgiana TaxID=44398 RepID=UPI0025ABD101
MELRVRKAAMTLYGKQNSVCEGGHDTVRKISLRMRRSTVEANGSELRMRSAISELKNSQISNVGNPRIFGNSGNSQPREFRVLQAGVRPRLRLPRGGAFFRSGSRSRKNPGKSQKTPGENPQEPARNLPETAGKENREKTGKNQQECSGKEEPSGTSADSRDPPAQQELGSPCPAGLFPIFLPSRRRPLEELPAPFGPSGKTPRKSRESSWDQLIIDAGQHSLGPRQCGSCGMLFAPGVPEDRLQHLRHHRRLRQALTHTGWKQERVVAEFWDGKILLILPEDPKYALRKAEEVLAVVDSELGFPEHSRPGSGQRSRLFPAQSRVYLFVSPGQCVLGCLVAQPIRHAFRVLPEPGLAPLPDPQDPQNSQGPRDPRGDSRRDPQSDPCARAWRCSLCPEPAACGISRLWVLGARRRRGIARRMMDALRRTFVFGAVLSSRDLAFSDPTADGRGFAARYCGRHDFLVYSP